MIRIMIAFGVLAFSALAGVITLYLRAAGDYQVLPTVSDDATLPSVELNGYTFHAEDFGNPGAPVIIVLHGGPGGDYRSLLPLSDLADTHHIVFYDQRGAGLSPRVDADQLTPAGALADLDAFVDHYSPNAPITLIGHSWGAILADGYLRHHPQRVAATVLAEPGYLDQAEYEAWQDHYGQLMSGWTYTRLTVQGGFEAQHVDGPDSHAPKDYLVGQRILPAFTNHPDNPYHCPDEPYDAPSWRWGNTASEALSGETFTDPTALTASYEGPVLFLAGACNTWIGEQLQASHTLTYPNAELAVVPDAGHDMFWDNPDHTLATIRRFLDRQPDPDTPAGSRFAAGST